MVALRFSAWGSGWKLRAHLRQKAVRALSKPWHLGTLLAIDTETTGTNVENDRLVTACVAHVDGSGTVAPRVQTWLAWPGIDIPASATTIHGITTAEAHEHGLPAVQVIAEVAQAILESASSGTPLVLFNASYDLTLLDRETRRYGLDPFGPALDFAKALTVDSLVLDKAVDRYRRGSRNLAAVTAHYGVKLEGAHSADGDALAAVRVAWKIARKYPAIAEMSPTELHAYQVKHRAEQQSSLRQHFLDRGEREKAETVDGFWPWRPLAEEAAA